jgi:hypothetical protein
MRITIDIASPVLEEARRLTRKEGVTLSALVTEGLHTVVAAREPGKDFVFGTPASQALASKKALSRVGGLRSRSKPPKALRDPLV